MNPPHRRLIVVGDRVLIKQDRPEDRTEVGLYLPESVVAKEKVQGGLIVAAGPGIPLPDPDFEEEEPWRESQRRARHLPMQAEVGDYALFLKKHSVEIRYESQQYLIVPQAAILVLLRDDPAGH
ncbi:MAG: co-chaperone GroES [Candidatus Sumerlaeia bacterium]|nr:co-chaperone GroES [Candidatus Sumerlaeia bacterium]